MASWKGLRYSNTVIQAGHNALHKDSMRNSSCPCDASLFFSLLKEERFYDLAQIIDHSAFLFQISPSCVLCQIYKKITIISQEYWVAVGPWAPITSNITPLGGHDRSHLRAPSDVWEGGALKSAPCCEGQLALLTVLQLLPFAPVELGIPVGNQRHVF